MNIFIGSGTLIENAVIRTGQPHSVEFVIAAKHGFNGKTREERTEFVPCVILNPSDKLQALLTGQGKGLFVEFKGRVAASRTEEETPAPNTARVIVNKSSFTIVTRRS